MILTCRKHFGSCCSNHMFSGSAVVLNHNSDLIQHHPTEVVWRYKIPQLDDCLHSTLSEEEMRPLKECGIRGP